MSDLAIQISNLSKQYHVGAPRGTGAKGRSLGRALLSPFSYLISTMKKPAEDEVLWALKDVSFDIKQGEVIGLVGRNGAGKSTLLKILSRITEPTSGRAVVCGRVGSLLEVGTGFHPELTGRENVYLNGAILGMKKAETDRKFDEIVEFAEVGRFIDMPVKRYSSGMYVRLAFAVAAHLEPEVLLVDEVLAVGDLAFQQKCLNRIKTLTTSGMTIVLVSHNMTVIQSSCSRAVLLKNGRIAANGDPVEVVHAYQEAMQTATSGWEAMDPGSAGAAADAEGITIEGFEMAGEDGEDRRSFKFGEAVRVRIHVRARKRIEHPMINFGIRRGDGVVVSNFNNWYDNFKIDYLEGDCVLEGWLPPLRLVPDYYEIHVLVWPWGGGHLAGDLTRSQPYAWTTFGSFRIEGLGLNSHDGVYQEPALKWRFQRDGRQIEFEDITEQSVYRAFEA